MTRSADTPPTNGEEVRDTHDDMTDVDIGMAVGGVDAGMAVGGVDAGMAVGGVDAGMAVGDVDAGMAVGDVDAGMAVGGIDAGMAEDEAIVGRYDFEGPAHRVAADSRGRTLDQDEYKKMTRRSLLTGAGALGAGFLAWNGVPGAAPSTGRRSLLASVLNWNGFRNRDLDNRIPGALRAGHELNENIWRGLFREGALAPTFEFAESSDMRINGRHGLDEEVDVDAWELTVIGRDGQTLGTHVIDHFRSMRQTEMTVEHKCVEGWAHIVTWGGVLFSEFVDEYYPEQAQAKFVGLSTPDGEFNVGLDMASMLHPQTMLTLDLQRAPLSDQHGAPLRLTTPLKYGTKQIKRIGTIRFSDTQPENDYWTVRGYDWYAAL